LTTKASFPSGEIPLRAAFDPVREREVLIVHDQQAVGSGGDADVPAGSREHPNGSGDLLRFDLDLGEIVALGQCGGGRQHHDGGPT
jgi:hypothetical protein